MDIAGWADTYCPSLIALEMRLVSCLPELPAIPDQFPTRTGQEVIDDANLLFVISLVARSSIQPHTPPSHPPPTQPPTPHSTHPPQPPPTLHSTKDSEGGTRTYEPFSKYPGVYGGVVHFNLNIEPYSTVQALRPTMLRRTLSDSDSKIKPTYHVNQSPPPQRGPCDLQGEAKNQS